MFINGLPVITFELKNQLTKQDVDDAVNQYKTDRDPRELLFQFKRCMVHFAVDDARVKFCTKIDGKGSWFLPFDKGYNDGAGNPPNPIFGKRFLLRISLVVLLKTMHRLLLKKTLKQRKRVLSRYSLVTIS